MLGHIEEWFYSGLLGIRADAPGFGRIVIKPHPVGDLAWAEGHYDSMHGRIQSSWKVTVRRRRLPLRVEGAAEWWGETTIINNSRGPATSHPQRDRWDSQRPPT
jgi:hypothetical protein